MYIYKKKLKFKTTAICFLERDNCAWVPATQWQASVPCADWKWSRPESYCQAGGDEELQPIVRTLLVLRPCARKVRVEGGESEEAQNSDSNPREFHELGLGEAPKKPSGLPGRRRMGPFLDSPKRKVQWQGTKWETRNGLNARQMFLSLLIPTWHFNSPDFKTFLPLGNIIKSLREGEKRQLIFNINNFKKNTL